MVCVCVVCFVCFSFVFSPFFSIRETINIPLSVANSKMTDVNLCRHHNLAGWLNVFSSILFYIDKQIIALSPSVSSCLFVCSYIYIGKRALRACLCRQTERQSFQSAAPFFSFSRHKRRLPAIRATRRTILSRDRSLATSVSALDSLKRARQFYEKKQNRKLKKKREREQFVLIGNEFWN